MFVLQTLNRIAVFFFLLGSCVFLDLFYLVSWVFLGFLLVSVVSAWFPGFSWVFCLFLLFLLGFLGFPGFP